MAGGGGWGRNLRRPPRREGGVGGGDEDLKSSLRGSRDGRSEVSRGNVWGGGRTRERDVDPVGGRGDAAGVARDGRGDRRGCT